MLSSGIYALVVEFKSHVGKNGGDVGKLKVHVGKIKLDVGISRTIKTLVVN